MILQRIFVTHLVVSAIVLLLSSDLCHAIAPPFLDRDSFTLLNPGLTLLDFEGFAPVGGDLQPAPAFPGTTITGTSFGSPSTGLIAIADADNALWGDPGFSTPTDILFVNSLSGFTMTIDFNNPVMAAGLLVNIGFSDSRVGRVRAFKGLEELAAAEIVTSNDFDAFVGFAGLGEIDRLIINASDTSRGDFVMIDDLMFGNPIPEPTTLTLATLGLLGVCYRRRK